MQLGTKDLICHLFFLHHQGKHRWVTCSTSCGTWRQVCYPCSLVKVMDCLHLCIQTLQTWFILLP